MNDLATNEGGWWNVEGETSMFNAQNCVAKTTNGVFNEIHLNRVKGEFAKRVTKEKYKKKKGRKEKRGRCVQ